MKPVLSQDEEGKDVYYDSVYNSLNMNGAEINIKNKNSGNNLVYGISSESTIYNTASLGEDGDVKSLGTINIEDTNSASKIFI